MDLKSVPRILDLLFVLQVVTMQFEGGATATLTMVAFTEKVCSRETKFYGTKVSLAMLSC